MPVVDRIKIALRGFRKQRTVLILDSNKVVAVAVLRGQKLEVTGIEPCARMTSVQEKMLQEVCWSCHWLKHHPLIGRLVTNTKTPTVVSMPKLPRLNECGLKLITRDRNVSNGVRAPLPGSISLLAKARSRLASRRRMLVLWAGASSAFGVSGASGGRDGLRAGLTRGMFLPSLYTSCEDPLRPHL